MHGERSSDKKYRMLAYLIKAIALLLAAMYLHPAYRFITSITPADYSAATFQEIWAVAELVGRMVAIGIGIIIAVIFNFPKLLALMFGFRLIEGGVGIFIITPNMDPRAVNFEVLLMVVESLGLIGQVILITRMGKDKT